MPSPCYPLYPTMNTCNKLENVFYNLEDEKSMTGKNAKALFIINPNNPTGQVLTRSEMQKIVKICVENKMVLIASEVLQGLVHSDNAAETPFLSFRKIIQEMPAPYNELELFSFYSASKSDLFEGGVRSGFMDILNLDKDVRMELYKHISMDICTNVSGQIVLDLIVHPPCESEKIFSTEFINEYRNDVDQHRNNFRNELNKKIQNLSSCELFKIKKPQAGFTLFIELKTEENSNLFENEKTTPGEIYGRALYEETGLICTPGVEYGDFPKHIALNLGDNYLDYPENVQKILNFNKKICSKKNMGSDTEMYKKINLNLN